MPGVIIPDPKGGKVWVHGPDLEFVEVLNSTPVPAKTTNFLDGEVKPPSGYKYVVLALEITVDAPPGATSGTHACQVAYNNGLRVLWGQSNYNVNIRYYYGTWHQADVLALPSDPAAQTLFPKGLELDENNYFQLYVHNYTSVAQTNQRTWRFLFQKVPLVGE